MPISPFFKKTYELLISNYSINPYGNREDVNSKSVVFACLLYIRYNIF